MAKFLSFIINTDTGRVVLSAILGFFLPLLLTFLKKIGKIAKSFLKKLSTQICNLTKCIYQKISENLKEIDYENFIGNHLRNGSVLFVIKSSELKYFKKIQGFDAIWYAYKSNQEKDKSSNLNTDKIIEAVKLVFMSLRKKDKRRLYKIYKARKQFANMPIQGKLDYCEDLEKEISMFTFFQRLLK